MPVQHPPCPADDIDATVRDAVRDGFEQHMTDERVRHMTRVAIAEVRDHLATQSGRFLLGGLGTLLARVMLFLIAGLVVYSIGGWSGLAALFKTMTGVEK